MTQKDIGNYILYSDGRVFRKHSNNFMKGSPNSDGYIHISINGKIYKLHRLIALHFLETPPPFHNTVNHKNGIKTDNRVENLEWCTPGHNVRHAFANGLMVRHKGSKNAASKLSEDQVLTIKKLLLDKISQYKIASEFNVSVSTINRIALGKGWGHVTL